MSEFPLIDELDISYESIMLFEQRMIEATSEGRVPWESMVNRGESFSHFSRSGGVYVEREGVTIWDERGTCLRKFHYPTNALFESIMNWHAEREKYAESVLDRMLAELVEMG